MIITSPEKFAVLFNEKYPGTYRKITTQDVRDMTTCGLIGRYGFYLRVDLETIRGILEYEQLQRRNNYPLVVRCAGNFCLYSLKVKREDQESIVLNVNLLEMEIAKGGLDLDEGSSTKSIPSAKTSPFL